MHELPERRTSVQTSACKAFVDHGHVPRAADVEIRQQPSGGRAQRERFGVSGIDLMHDDGFVAGRRTWHLGGRPHIPERVESGIQSNRRDAGHGAHAREQVLVERIPS